MSQPNQPPTGPNLPYGQEQPQSQQTPPTQPQDAYRGDPSSGGSAPGQQSYGGSGSYASAYGGQQAQPQPQAQPAPSSYGGYGGYQPTAPQYNTPKRSGTLGTVALVLTLLAIIGYVVFSVLSGQATVDLAEMSGGTVPDDPAQIDQAATEKAAVAFGFMAAQTIPSLFGLAGFICGIVAAATRRGRALGVVAIVLAVLAPIIGFIVYGAIVAPIAQ